MIIIIKCIYGQKLTIIYNNRTYAVGVNKCINSNIKLDTNKQLRRFEKSFMAA